LTEKKENLRYRRFNSIS